MPHFFQFYKDFEKNKKRLDIEKAAQNLQIPQLIIHGNNDTSVLIQEAENLHKWNPKSEFKNIKNADYVFNIFHPWKEKTISKELGEVINSAIIFLNKCS